VNAGPSADRLERSRASGACRPLIFREGRGRLPPFGGCSLAETRKEVGRPDGDRPLAVAVRGFGRRLGAPVLRFFGKGSVIWVVDTRFPRRVLVPGEVVVPPRGGRGTTVRAYCRRLSRQPRPVNRRGRESSASIHIASNPEGAGPSPARSGGQAKQEDSKREAGSGMGMISW